MKVGLQGLLKLPGWVEGNVPFTMTILSSAPQIKCDTKAILMANMAMLHVVCQDTGKWRGARNQEIIIMNRNGNFRKGT